MVAFKPATELFENIEYFGFNSDGLKLGYAFGLHMKSKGITEFQTI